jgi:hypothetical protein
MVLPIAGGIGLATRRDGNPGSPSSPDTYFADLIRSSAQDAWSEYRASLAWTLHDQLGRGDLIAPGVTLYDLDIAISPTIDLSVERDDSGDLVVHVTTGGSSITATSTTPTALGSYADPRLSLAFGLDLTYRIDLPPTTQPLAATGFTSIHVLDPRLDSQNFIADVAFLINDVVHFFGGPDFVAILERFLATTDFAPYVNNALAPINDKLTQLAADGYWFLEALVDRLDGGAGSLHGLSIPGAPADRMDLLLTAFGFDRSGAVEGVITWPRSLGAPTDLPLADIRRTLSASAAVRVAEAAVAALQRPRTEGWTAVTSAEAAPTEAGAAAVQAADDASRPSAQPSSPVAAQAADTIAGSLQQMSADEAQHAADELRSAVADRYIAVVGGAERFAALREEFLKGRSDFAVPVTVGVGGAGLFVDQRAVGTLAHLWAEDDETTCRRRYLVVELPIDTPLSVSASLAEGWSWAGAVSEVACRPSGWSGSVMVHRAPPHVSLATALADQVEVHLSGHERVFGRVSDLEQAGIIIVSGRDPSTVELNPQPIPPGDEASLNPQPLPPRERTLVDGSRVIDLSDDAPAAAHLGAAQLVHAGAVAHAGPVLALAHKHAAGWQQRVGVVTGETSAVVAALRRDDPTGYGTVRGIDFTVEEYTAPVIR